MSASVRSPRGRRGAIATVVAALGLLLCAAGAFEAVWLAGHSQTWGFRARSVSGYLGRTRLGDPVVLIVGIVVAVLGLLLVVAALVPPRRPLVELSCAQPAVAAGVTRRSLRRTLAAAAIGVDGVSAVRVRAGRRRTAVAATTALRHVDGLEQRVRDAVEARLADLHPATTRPVRVSLTQKEH